MTKAPAKSSAKAQDPDEPNGGQTAPPDDPPPPAKPDQMALDKSLRSVDKDEIEALLRAGTRLRQRGSDPETGWTAMTRHDGVLCLCVPVTPEGLAAFIEDYDDLVVAG